MASAVVQDEIYPPHSLRRPRSFLPWLKRNVVICDEEGWSLTFSGSTWRIDCYEYRESGRDMVFGGEGATQQWDVFIPRRMSWQDSLNEEVDEVTRTRILRRVTSAIQFMGYKVGFFEVD